MWVCVATLSVTDCHAQYDHILRGGYRREGQMQCVCVCACVRVYVCVLWGVRGGGGLSQQLFHHSDAAALKKFPVLPLAG